MEKANNKDIKSRSVLIAENKFLRVEVVELTKDNEKKDEEINAAKTAIFVGWLMFALTLLLWLGR